jgi:hypothetical protein
MLFILTIEVSDFPLFPNQSSGGESHFYFSSVEEKNVCAFVRYPNAKALSSACWFPHKHLLNLSRATNKVFTFNGACLYTCTKMEMYKKVF